jgi:nitrous oxide reductase
MPSQDANRPSEQTRRLSRRSMLRGAATAGAAGLAVTAIGSAASPAFAATKQAQNHSVPVAAPEVAGSIMVHVRDAKSGDIEVFSGTSKTRLRDKDLAARIARAIG